MKKQLRSALCLVLPVILFLCLTVTNAFYSGDMLLCDMAYKQLEAPDRHIRIIAVDEKTEAAYGKFNQWSREKMTQLMQLFLDGPAVVVFDIMFVGGEDADGDAALALACENAGNVVCASNLIYGGRLEETAEGGTVYNPAAILGEERPYEALDRVTRSGFSNACISEDNVIRYAQLYARQDGILRYSLAYEAYRAYGEKMGLPVELPETRGGQTGFFYSGEPGDIPHVSLVDVLEGRIPLSEFENCLVFVGAYASGFQDAYHTPVSRGQQMHGVEINANITLALMKGKLANPVPVMLYGAVASAILAVWLLFLNRQKLGFVLTEAAALTGLHLLAGWLLARNGYLIPQVYFPCTVFFAVICSIVQKYMLERIRHSRALQTLKKYVAPQIVEKLSRDGSFDLRLGGEKRHIAVLFVDIRGFTTLSESLQPEAVVQMLNRYLSVTTRAVFANEGTLDKFVGDATMAVFNAPFSLEDYVFRAVKTAWDIQRGVEELARTAEIPVRVGVGVHCGEAVVGNIGSDVRMDYTAIGDTVNTAARLEGSAKPGQILISQAVYDAVGHRLTVEPLGEMALKGKAESVAVYCVTGFRE